MPVSHGISLILTCIQCVNAMRNSVARMRDALIGPPRLVVRCGAGYRAVD